MKKNKKIDAAKLMRQIRDEMSREIEGMSYEEQKRYLSSRQPVKSVEKKQPQASESKEAM